MIAEKTFHKNKNKSASEQYFFAEYEKISLEKLQKLCSNIERENRCIVRIFATGNQKDLQAYLSFQEHYPCIFLGNTQGESNMHYFSIQTISRSQYQCEYIKWEKRIVGLVAESSGEKYAFISHLKNFSEIENILSLIQFSGENIVRFWNYIENVLQNYAQFNKDRDVFFLEHNIQKFPAATGIEAKLFHPYSLSFDAVTPMPMNILQSDMQCEAWEYGPKFSRGVYIDSIEGERKIYISGTSSVNMNGHSILLNNSEKNVEYVFECFEHILFKAQATIDNLQFVIVYCKNEEYYKIFKDFYKKRSYTFSYIPLFVPICRDSFFFEIEGIAYMN